MIKNVQAIVQDAIGYSYTWAVVSSNCSTPIISTNLGYGTENNVAGDGTITASPVILKNTITTLPDNCAVTIALEIYNTTNELCNQYYFDLESNIVNANYNWKCVDINDGYGCQQFAGLPTVAGEFDSETLCNECSDCPCNQDNVNEICDCVIDVNYDCNTSTLTVTNNSNIVDTNCLSLTVGDIFIGNDIVYSGGTLLIGNSIVIPNIILPNGTYYTSFTFIGNGLVSSCNFEKSFLVNCVGGEVNNVYCCNQIANDATGNVANINNKDGYILDISGISNTLYIDFGYNMVADQIFVYTGIQDIDNLISGDLIASTPPCGDTNSCHNNVPCVDNITDDIVEGFWTGTGIYESITNPGISGQTIGVRNNLLPAWSPELYDINTATHTNPGFLPTATGGGILAGQGRLAILAADYINPSNKLTIVVYNNGSICPSTTPGCNNTYNKTAYKFIVVCPDCEEPVLTIDCGEEVELNLNVLVNDTPGEYTDFSINITDKICGSNVLFAIDYNMLAFMDRIKVYYNNTVMAATPYIGTNCPEITQNVSLPLCNGIVSTSTSDCYMSGFYLNTNIQPDSSRNNGLLIPLVSVPALLPPYDLTYSTTAGTGRLIVDVPYVNGQDTAVIRVFNNYNILGNCNTNWTIKPVCLPCEVTSTDCPTVVATSNAPFCEESTINLYSSITNGDYTCTGISYYWTGPDGFTSVVANPTIPNATLDNQGTYYLTVTYSDPACQNCDLSTSVIVNGFSVPDSPSGFPSNVNACTGATATLSSVNVNPCCPTCTTKWYTTLTGGTAIHTGVSYTTPALNTTTTYYVACEDINGNCNSTPRVPITVTVAPCCNTTMSANNISTCLDTNGGTLPVTYTFSTACTTSSVTVNFTNGWTYNSSTNSITYPPNTSPGTYTVDLDWICDTCFGTTTINVILNKPIVTAVPINNTCPTTSVSLYSAISVTPTVGINSGNTIFKTGAVCGSNGILTGGTTITDSPVANITNWSSIGATTIWYQYTDSVTNCKSCGSFVATVNACCNTTMTVNDVVTCLSPTGGTVNLVANYAPACPTGDIVSVTLPTPSWTFNPANNSITYPANVAPNTYTLTATLNCGVCTTLYTFSFTINTATVTMQNIANDCNNLLNPTTVDLNDAIVTSDPLYTIVYRQYNILTNNTPICSSTGTLTGGLLINNPTSWTVPIGTTTIYYQYTNTATGCKKCGSFIVTGTTCCTVSAGDNTTQTTCI
jgi:hypothetical protein